MNFLYLYISLLLITIFCYNFQTDLVGIKNTDNVVKKVEYSDKPIIKTTKLDFAPHRLVVKTTIINDSLLSCNLILDIKVIQQKLLFYKKDTEINSVFYKPQKLEISTINVKKLYVFENVINEISVLQGRDGWLYNVNGVGITGNQTEFSGLFTPAGQLVYYSYSTSRNMGVPGVPNELKGNLDSVLNKYKIDMGLFLHPKHVISVDY